MTTAAPSPPQASSLEGLPDHTGRPRDPALEMFAPPPAEIGTPSSGSSSLRVGKTGMPLGLRLVLCALLVGAGLAIAAGIGPGNNFVKIAALGIAGLAALAVWRGTAFLHHCDYLGEGGLAQIEVAGSRSGPRTTIVMRWTDAAALHTSETHVFRNRVYQHTDYAYGWWDGAKNLKFAIAGRYDRAVPAANDRIHFARAAENAWNQFYLPYLQEQLRQEGSVPFRLGADEQRMVRVGSGFLEFHGFEAQPVRVTRAEIATLSLEDGEFRFKHVDARWYSSHGRLSFHYGAMPNARLFLMMVEQLMGVRL